MCDTENEMKTSRKIFETKKYEYFVITSPGFDEPPEYIFDKLLEVLKSL